MKQKLLLSTTALVISFFSQAQVPNGTFELLTSDNHVSQWVKNFLISISIDSTGEFHSDSIVFDHSDNQLYRATTDAHTGAYALEMTNAYNYTTNSGMTGGAFLASSDFYSAISPEVVYMDPIQPETFSFYYKYFPQATDSALAVLTLFDIDGIQISETKVSLGGTVSDYTLVSLPIQYDMDVPAHAMSITFATAQAGHQPTPGTKFIVDDVELSGNLGINEESLELSLYPNPANSTFQLNEMVDSGQVELYDLEGKHIKTLNQFENCFNVSGIQNGSYIINYSTNSLLKSARLSIAH